MKPYGLFAQADTHVPRTVPLRQTLRTFPTLDTNGRAWNELYPPDPQK